MLTTPLLFATLAYQVPFAFVIVAVVAPAARPMLAAAPRKYRVLLPVLKLVPLPSSRSCVTFRVPLSVMLLPIVTWFSVPLLLVSVVPVRVPLAIVPLRVVAPVRAVVPPLLSMVPEIALPPVAFRVTLSALPLDPAMLAPE